MTSICLFYANFTTTKSDFTVFYLLVRIRFKSKYVLFNQSTIWKWFWSVWIEFNLYTLEILRMASYRNNMVIEKRAITFWGKKVNDAMGRYANLKNTWSNQNTNSVACDDKWLRNQWKFLHFKLNGNQVKHGLQVFESKSW